MQNSGVPAGSISREQAREIDRRAAAEFGMSTLVLMENAGRGLADRFFQLGLGGPVLICCGSGNNGGDGLVMARHLDLRHVPVNVLIWGDASRFTADAKSNFAVLERSAIPFTICGRDAQHDLLATALQRAGCVVDALLGTGATGEPRPPLDAVIDQINAHGAPTLAVDLPSGLDCDTGQPAVHTVRANHTCTFVAPKIGFATAAAKPFLGIVHVLDIGAPRVLIDSVIGRSK